MKNGQLLDPTGDFSQWTGKELDETYEDAGLQKKLVEISKDFYNTKVAAGCEISKKIGNTYTASVYMNMAGLICSEGSKLASKSITLFSYGSGALASMFSIIPSETGSGSSSSFTLKRMQEQLNIKNRLANREELSPIDLATALKVREAGLHPELPYTPKFLVENMVPGTYYLDEITKNYERVYKRKPLDDMRSTGLPLMSLDDYASLSPTGSDKLSNKLSKMTFNSNPNPNPGNSTKPPRDPNSSKNGINGLGPQLELQTGLGIRRNETQIWSSGRPNKCVVVTGIAAALPGRNKEVFEKGVNNVRRIIEGESFIGPIPDSVKDSNPNANPSHLLYLSWDEV
jgi:hypothetical protein